jgi:SAM-dependent methyltransferase
MQTLTQFADTWQNSETHARHVVETFTDAVNADLDLKALRDFVEQRGYGFGERCFYHMWKLIIQELRPGFKFLEIGIFKGQILALVRMLAGPHAEIYGITPLDTSGGMPEGNYAKDIADLHLAFNLPLSYTLWEHRSDDAIAIWAANENGPFDVVYIDGGHSYQEAKHDIEVYGALVKPGGFLVVDDCANAFSMPWGYFRGIQDVSLAVDNTLPPHTLSTEWLHLGCVMHNRIWKKL